MSLTRLRESTSQARDFRLAKNERHQGGDFPGASRCRGATTGRCILQLCANGHGHRVCRVVLPWAQDTVLGCPRPPTTSAISSPTAARPKPRAKRPGRRLSLAWNGRAGRGSILRWRYARSGSGSLSLPPVNVRGSSREVTHSPGPGCWAVDLVAGDGSAVAG